MLSFRKLLFLLFCIATTTSVVAQEAPRIRNYAPTDYGSQNQNWSLAQSPEGWVYAGNNGGLLEFDGARFQMYAMPEKQTVRTVAIGRDGAIFCGGFAEFGFWKKNEAGRLTYTSLSNDVRAEQLGKEEIWHILTLPDYVLFQSFSTIYKFDYQKITVLRPPEAIMFAREVNGRVLLPVIGRGLYELLPDNTFQFVENTEILSDKIVQFLVPGDTGEVWAGTTNHGIFEIKKGLCRAWDNPLNAEFRKFQLNKAIALKNGGWAIGTILNGAYVLDARKRLRFHLHRENGLQNNTVLALNEDRDGNLWLGLDRGIDCAALRSPLHIFTDQTGRIGTVYTAAEWGGKLFIGTNQGVFARPLKQGESSFQNEKFRLVEGTQGQVWQLQVFDGQLICGHNSGTFAIENGRAWKISDVTGGWCTVRVPAHPDALLQSTYTGLVVFRKNSKGRWQYAHRVGGFSEPLKKIAFDADGSLWGAHPNKGLFRLRLNGDLTQIIAFKAFSREDGLPTDFHLDLASLGEQLIVNVSPTPMSIVFDKAKQQHFFVEMPQEFARKKVLAGIGEERFLADSSGVRFQAGASSYYFPLTLVPSFENIVSLTEGKYLFCLENGFATLDKKQLAAAGFSNSSPVGATIRWVETASGERFSPENDLNFDWRQNSLKFRFAASFFERSPNFSWRLEGFSSQWSPWQSAPEKEFINLPAGEYTFVVRTDVGGAEAQLKFRIAPPWHRSKWALVVYTLLAISIFWGVEKINRARLQRQLQHLEEEKKRELEHQRMEAEREKLLLEVENKSRELSNAALNLIRKNTALQHLKENLMDSKNDPRAMQKIVRQIDEHLEGDHDWEIFEESFNRVHDDFFKRLMHDFPDLTPGDLRLAAYLKMNLASKEIAPLLNISVRGVENKRYRLRKKLGLPEDANLTEFVMAF